MNGQEQPAVLLLRGSIGALFLWAAYYAWSSGSWYRRASWVLAHGDRVEMKADYGFNEKGALIVNLSGVGRDHLAILCTPRTGR